MLGDENGIVQKIGGETLGLTGEFQHNLDAKGRLFIPAKLKEGLGSVYFVTVSMDKCLSVYSSDSWERLSEKVSAMSYTQQRKIRPIFAVAARCELDAQGRILLPQNLRDFAGLTKGVTVIGANNHAEIWDTEAWNAKKSEEMSPEHIAEIFEELGF
jgi:MraZ protein